MRSLPLALMIGATAVTAQAATIVTGQKPVTIVVDTPSHDFVPQVVRVPGNRPIQLVIRNPSGIDHNFYAPEFFYAAKINDADAGNLVDERVEVPQHSTRSIRLIARPGHYNLKSTKVLDVAGGMTGQILVY